MNAQLEEYARKTLKQRLQTMPPHWQETFKRMYSPNNLSAPIDEVVDKMPVKHLDWAMTQVENSHKKLEKQTRL